MQRLIVAIVAMAAALAVGCGGQPTTRHYELAVPKLDHARNFDLGRQGHWRQLENGLRLLVLPDPRSNLVTVDVRYRVGAAEDPAGKPGLAHLVEHLTYEVEGDDGRTLTERLAQSALYHNAFTTADATHYTARGHGTDLLELLSIESERMRLDCERLSEPMFERERDVVASEIRQRGIDPLRTALARAIYGAKHPYARPVGGTLRALETMTRLDVCEFWTRYYGPSSAILIVAGNVDEDHVDDLVSEAFGPLKNPPLAPRAPLPSPDFGARTVRLKGNVDKPMAFLAFPAPVFADRENVYASYLREDLEERVAGLVEASEGLTDSAVIRFGGARMPVYVVMLEGETKKALSFGVEGVFRRAKRLASDVDPMSIKLSAPNRMTRLLLRTEPVSERALWYADYAQYSRHPGFVAKALDNQMNVTSRHIRSRARGFLDKKRSVLVYVVPGGKEKLSQSEELFDEGEAGDFEYDIPEWSVRVDPDEVDRAVEVPALPVRPRAIEFTLDNGLEVVLVPDLSYPVVDARLVLPVGSLDEPKGKPYLAHLAAWLQSRSEYFGNLSGRKYRKLVERLIALVKMGGLINIEVGPRTTTYRIRGLSAYTDGLLWLLYQRSFTGHYEQDVVARYNEAISATKDEAEDEDDADQIERERQTRLLRRALYGAGHPYAASAEEPRPVRVADLEAFRDQHYKASGARLIVVGRFLPSVVRDQAKRLFGEMQPGARPRRPSVPAVARRSGPEHLLLDTGDDQVTMTLAYAAAPGKRERAAARKVLAELLRQRLARARQKLGSTYGIAVRGTYDARGPGMLTIRGAIDAQRARSTIEMVVGELDRVRAGDDDIRLDFARARRRVLSSLLLSEADSDSEADAREIAVRDGLPADYQQTLVREVAELRLADIAALVADELGADQQLMMLSGRRARLEQLYRALGVKDPTVLE